MSISESREFTSDSKNKSNETSDTSDTFNTLNTSNTCNTSDTSDTTNYSNLDSENTSSNYEPLSELENLIIILKKGIKKNEPGIQVIKYPNMLVDVLEELNNMIGMDRLKESIALQTLELIENMKESKPNMSMLHTVLYGGPGLGKTRMGKILAKIWFALGYLENYNKTKVKKTYVSETPGLTDDANFYKIVLILLAWGGTYILQFFSYMYKNMGLFWISIILGFIIFTILIFYWASSSEWVKEYIYETYTEEQVRNADDKEIIKVVSREDFVAGYLGQTAAKTKALLEANVGKVLFIDEAYSLLNDIRDAYGMEALTTLNQYMSENPDKIVVIFAGYKAHMQTGIFAAQPGLPRRCMWKFNCDPYSGQQLADIMFIQAEKEGWIISNVDKKKIAKLIVRNESLFKNYGGDTERLVYLSGLESSRKKLSRIDDSFLSSCSKSKESKKKILTFENVESGLIRLKENSF